ncbi:MAG: hypothetical protein AB2826_27110, partial [Candidatus Thiodiazotropha sp.]
RFRECRPRHYPASLASDEGAFGSGTPCARHLPVTRPATNRLVQAFGAFLPAHWGPQTPLSTAPPLARELEARVAVAGNYAEFGIMLSSPSAPIDGRDEILPAITTWITPWVRVV